MNAWSCHLRELRRATAAVIIADPARFCVCRTCGGIAHEPAPKRCPECHGYSWEHRAAEVVARAHYLAENEPQSVTRQDMIL
jgi:hypothetical protein